MSRLRLSNQTVDLMLYHYHPQIYFAHLLYHRYQTKNLSVRLVWYRCQLRLLSARHQFLLNRNLFLVQNHRLYRYQLRLLSVDRCFLL